MTPDSTQPLIARIERLALWTEQLPRLRDFYVGQLGAQASPLYEDPATGRRAVFLDFCGVGLELIEPPATAERRPEPRPGCAYIAFALGSADAVDRLAARLAAAGHPAIEPPHRSSEGCYQSVVLDPDGNHIALTV
jgi:lactoylglutathione lyase